MKHDIFEANNLSRSRGKVMSRLTLTHVTKIEYKNINCLPLLCHGTRMASMMMSVSYKFNKKSSSPQDLVIDYVQKVRFVCF